MSESYLWRELSKQWVFETPYHRISKDRLLHPRGHELDYFVVHHRLEAAGTVAVDDGDRVLMVQQWRHPVRKLLWGIPSGSIESGESPAAGAARELREETGWAAGRVEPLCVYHPQVGTTNQTFHLFLGGELRRQADFDPIEVHSMAWFDRGQVRQMIRDGEMVDGLSLTGLLMWLDRSGPGPVPPGKMGKI